MADPTERAAEPEEAVAAAPEETVEEVVGTELEPVAPPAPQETAPQPRVVYIEAPTPPRSRGNRVVGGLLALIGGVVFALAYALVVFLFLALAPGAAQELVPSALGPGTAFGAFLGSAAFWVPVLFFTLFFVVLVLVLNRAGWWLHILGSVVVAVLTLLASVGTLLLLDGVVLMTGSQAGAAFWSLLLDPRLLIAAVVGREVAIWVGLAIAARGRRVKARNAERRAAFDLELAEKRAEHERAAAFPA